MGSNLDNTSLVKIEGQGEKLFYIVDHYIELIHSDFNCTVADVAAYLGVTNDYVLNTLKNQIKHIRINTVVRDAFVHYIRENSIDFNEDIYRLFIKRILFSKEDFKRFILENCYYEMVHKTLTLEDFDLYTTNSDKHINLIKKLNAISRFIYGEAEKPIKVNIRDMPNRLYSMKQIKKRYEINHNVEFYRFINLYGVNKIKLLNNVRYDLDDLISDPVIINYEKWIKLGRKRIINEMLSILNGEKYVFKLTEWLKNN